MIGNRHTIRTAIAVAAMAGIAVLAGCGNDESDADFTALDADDIVAIMDGALTEESGLKGLISADQIDQRNIDEMNATARRFCDDLADGVSGDEARAFQADTAGLTAGLDDVVDAVAMVRAVIEISCPANLATYDGTTGG